MIHQDPAGPPRWWHTPLGLLYRIHRAGHFQVLVGGSTNHEHLSELGNAGLIIEIKPGWWTLTTAGHVVYDRTFVALDRLTARRDGRNPGFTCKNKVCFCRAWRRRRTEAEWGVHPGLIRRAEVDYGLQFTALAERPDERQPDRRLSLATIGIGILGDPDGEPIEVRAAQIRRRFGVRRFGGGV